LLPIHKNTLLIWIKYDNINKTYPIIHDKPRAKETHFIAIHKYKISKNIPAKISSRKQSNNRSGIIALSYGKMASK